MSTTTAPADKQRPSPVRRRPLRRARTVQAFAPIRAMFSLASSAGGHAIVASPLLLWLWYNDLPELETPGEEGQEDGPTGNDGGDAPQGSLEPVHVSMYVEPSEATATTAEVEPTPAPGPVPQSATSATKGTADGTQDGRDALAERLGAMGHKPRGNRAPCEEIDEIQASGANRWTVERDVVDWYATHPKELEKQVGVATHEGADGKPDGARIFLPRCSLLRQAGIKHGDIVNSVNGRRVATLPDAIAAYLLLRGEENLVVEVTRRNGEPLTLRYRLKR